MRIAFAASVLCVALASSTASAQSYAFVVDVARSGTAFSNPIEALESITDASAEKPYLIRIHPGVYELGTTTIVGKPFVDIAGSGQGVTILKWSFPTNNQFLVALKAASNATVSDITIRGAVQLPADSTCNPGKPACATLRNVTIEAPNSAWGVYLLAAGVLDHVTVPIHHGSAVLIAGTSSAATGDLYTTLDHCALGHVGNISNGTSLVITGAGNTVTIKDSNTYSPDFALFTGSDAKYNWVRIYHSEILSSAWLYPTTASGTNNTFVFFDSTLLGAGMPAGAKCVGSVNYSTLTPITCP